MNGLADIIVGVAVVGVIIGPGQHLPADGGADQRPFHSRSLFDSIWPMTLNANTYIRLRLSRNSRHLLEQRTMRRVAWILMRSAIFCSAMSFAWHA